jgi:hypothetical protein
MEAEENQFVDYVKFTQEHNQDFLLNHVFIAWLSGFNDDYPQGIFFSLKDAKDHLSRYPNHEEYTYVEETTLKQVVNLLRGKDE